MEDVTFSAEQVKDLLGRFPDMITSDDVAGVQEVVNICGPRLTLKLGLIASASQNANKCIEYFAKTAAELDPEGARMAFHTCMIKQNVIGVGHLLAHDLGFSDDEFDSHLNKAATFGLPELYIIVFNHLKANNVMTSSRALPSLANAARYGRVEIVDFILNNMKFESTSEYFEAFNAALENAHANCLLRFLQEDRIEDCCDFNRALYFCGLGGLANVMEVLLRDFAKGKDVICSDAFQAACGTGSLSIVELLLADGRADPNCEDGEALQLACDNGYEEIVRCLLNDKRVNATLQDSKALVAASENGHEAIVEMLLEHNQVDPTCQDFAAMKLAAHAGINHLLYPKVPKDIVCYRYELETLMDDLEEPHTESRVMGVFCLHHFQVPEDLIHELFSKWTVLYCPCSLSPETDYDDY